MSRSFRKRPFASYCGNGSQKSFKQIYNRSMRRVNHVSLHARDEDAGFVIHEEVMDVWSMPRDGKRFYHPFGVAYLARYAWRDLTPEELYRRWWRWVKAK